MLELFFILCAFINCTAQFELFTQSSLRVYPYRNYGSTTVSNYKITPDVDYASFHFGAQVLDECDRETIHVYIRFGSLPVLDPKHTTFPNGFVVNNQNLYHLRNLSTKFNHSINIASPLHGYYFVVAYLHPRYIESNTIWNIAPKTCKIRLITSLYVQRGELPLRIQFNKTYPVFLKPNKTEPVRFQFTKPYKVLYAEVTLRNITYHYNSSSFVIQLTQSGILHSSLILSENEVTQALQRKIAINCALEEDILYGINFFSKDFISVNFDFEIGNSNPLQISSQENTKEYYTYQVRKLNPFTFFFHLLHSNSNLIHLNTHEVVTVLFVINDGFDIGGTLSFSVSSKLSGNQQVIVCINNTREVPMKPNLCVCNEQKSRSPMVLNAAVNKAVIHVPYPLPGIWFASFTLICLDDIRCSNYCQDRYIECTKNCTKEKCTNQIVCDLCKDTCAFQTSRFECNHCKKSNKALECPESNVTFTLASYSCLEGRCANGGICVQKISEGCAYSVCTCYNRFRGWTCSDGSNIASPQMIHLELFLILTSILIFLLDGYIAYKRKYYEESTLFVIKFFTSILSHSCHSGRYLYNLCIFDPEKFYTTDIYCGVLTLWVSFGAAACLRKPLRNIFHMIGAILVAYCVILNEPAWIYVAVIGFQMLVGIINWSYQNVMLHVRIPSNLYTYVYLPSGIVTFCSGALIYALLQNESNYMYTHSVWHILIGSSYILLMPDEKYTFPTVQSHSSSGSRRYVLPELSEVGSEL